MPYTIFCLLHLIAHTIQLCLSTLVMSHSMHGSILKLGQYSSIVQGVSEVCREVLLRTMIGSRRPYLFPLDDVLPFVKCGNINNNVDPISVFVFVDHINNVGLLSYPVDKNSFHANILLFDLISHVPIQSVNKITHIHHISIGSHIPKRDMPDHFKYHNCVNCTLYKSVFSLKLTSVIRKQKLNEKKVRNKKNNNKVPIAADQPLPCFPPLPLSLELLLAVITGFCANTSPQRIEEAGCTVCGKLTPMVT